MAGIKQHFIPQFLQRGFEAAKSGKHSQVWVCRKGQATYKSSTEGVAAQRHFYSEPSEDENTLDNVITRHEMYVLSPMIEELRNAHLGPVEPDTAASVVSHLSIRAAFLRGSYSEMAQKFLAHMKQTMSSDDTARTYMGIDSSDNESLIENTISDILSNNFSLMSDVARQRLVRIFKFRFRENFHADFKNMGSMLEDRIKLLTEVIPGAIESGHIRALEKEIVPQRRTEKLKSFTWNVVQVPEDSHVILPDCLSLGSTNADFSQLAPYTLIDDEALEGVLMPISSLRILIGTRKDIVIDWKTLNLILAQSSLEFFISSRNDDEIDKIAPHIGIAVSDHSKMLIEEVKFDAPTPFSQKKVLTAARVPRLVPVVEFMPKSLRNRAIERRIREQLRAPKLAPCLDHLRAFVVALDVAGALTESGVLLNDYGKQQVRFGTCQTRFTPQGFLCDVFMPIELAQLMVSTDHEQARSAGNLMRHQLGRAAYVHFFAKSVTPEEVQEQRGLLENSLIGMAQSAASHYFGARLFSPKEIGWQDFQTADALQAEAMDGSLKGLSQARDTYLAAPDVNNLLSTLVVFTETLITTAASGGVLRQFNPARWDAGKSARILEDAGLLNWFLLLSRDMETYFTARDNWEGVNELELLTTHAERIIWNFGFYLSPAGDQIMIDALNDQELEIIKKIFNSSSFI